MSNFTPEDLLEYFYREVSPKKRDAVKVALESHWTLQEKYNIIAQAAEKLDKSLVAPRKQSVAAVIEHAAKHAASADIGL
jgi:hypothetical protein